VNPLVTLINRIKQKQDELAVAAVSTPSCEPMSTGIRAGQWQGLEMATLMAAEILRDEQQD